MSEASADLEDFKELGFRVLYDTFQGLGGCCKTWGVPRTEPDC